MGDGRRTAAARMPMLLLCGAWLMESSAGAQIPEKFENLQVFPDDTPRGRLIQRMREFSFALGVRCQHCHVGPEGNSLEGVVFRLDDKVEKQKARFMLRMVDDLNQRLREELPDGGAPPVPMTCATCHRGSPRPRTLDMVLLETIQLQGVDAAVEQYRELRKDAFRGRFDFGEWSINELARDLDASGDPAAAVALLEMNAEYYPDSAAIDFQLAELHRTMGEREQAIARYRRGLSKSPGNESARKRLAELLAQEPR